MVAGEGAEDLHVGVEPGLRPGDHGAADARLRRDECGGPDPDGAPNPCVLDPAVPVDVDQDVGAEPARIPDAARMMTSARPQRCRGQQQHRSRIDKALWHVEQALKLGVPAKDVREDNELGELRQRAPFEALLKRYEN